METLVHITYTLVYIRHWTPKTWGGRFRVLERGQPLLFKLRSPGNTAVGGGLFEHYSDLPISLAWRSPGNGRLDFEGTVRARGRTHDRGASSLAEPFFWTERDWIPQAEDWAPSTQRGKGYDLRARIERGLWTLVSDRLSGTIVSEPGPAGWLDLPGGYGDPVPVRARVGQGIFRTVVADVYGRQEAPCPAHWPLPGPSSSVERYADLVAK